MRTAFAFDSALNSSTFVAGPLVAGALVTVVSPVAGIAVAAVAKLTGDSLLATTTGLGRGAPAARPGPLGPLRSRRVRMVLTIVSLDTFGYGCLDIVAVAHGNDRGWVAGLLLGALSAGEVAGGLGYGARSVPGVNQLLLTEVAPPAYRTEAFAWLGTFMWAGFGVGTATAGRLQDHLGSAAVLTAAAGAALGAAALAALWTTADARR